MGEAKSKSCNPCLNAVIVQGVLFSIKLDHIASQVLHLNSPGATSGFILLTILYICRLSYNYPCFIYLVSRTTSPTIKVAVVSINESMVDFDLDDKMFQECSKKEIINGFTQKPIRLHTLFQEVNNQLHSYEMQKMYAS
ncbi:MAG TPA: hypothetical protein VLD84_04270 [Nitrososphaeraceae archaeon]|nr:hypothetical protein [Nitrososphaeraceae archaeon]